MKQTIMESECGVLFRVIHHKSQYRLYIYKVPNEGEMTEVYGKCIKKYTTFEPANLWFNRFEALSDDEKVKYLAKFDVKAGKQKITEKKETVIKRVVKKQVWVRRNTGEYRKYSEIISNPEQLKYVLDSFKKEGYEVFTESTCPRNIHIEKDKLSEARDKMIFEDKMIGNDPGNVKAPKKSRSANFWNKK